MLTVAEALACVLDHARPLGSERVGLAAAMGRVLADAVRADDDLPRFDRAAMDGYALRAEEATSALEVIGEVRAGEDRDLTPGPGQAVAIMTGARVPATATAVVPFEQTTRSDDGSRVEIRAAVVPGQHIARRGSEVKAGALVLEQGRQVDAAAIAVLASVGRHQVDVGRRPTVSIVATGDELVEVADRPGPTQIRNSNGAVLEALASEAGGSVRTRRRVGDRAEALAEALEEGLASDVLLVSGGVSAGTTDLVPPTLGRLGADILFHSVAVKPGKPLLFARRGETRVFGLPGNPVSVQVAFRLFARPCLLAMQGARPSPDREIPVRLSAPLRNRSGRRAYVPIRVRVVGHELLGEPVASQGSADLVAHARAEALAILEAGRAAVGAGETVMALALPAFLEAEAGE